MILVDTSVWVDYFRRGDLALRTLLSEGRVLQHPFVTGELALGDLRPRREVIALLSYLPVAPVIPADDFLPLVETEGLVAIGLGFVDAHLLLSARRHPGLRLWTRDKRLGQLADTSGVGWIEPQP